MKVLYIQSGYGGIYSYFDRWAEECFQNTHTEYMIADKPEAESLMKIEAFQPDFTLMMVGDRVPHDWLTWLKGKDIPVYVWLTEDPFYMDISLQVIKLAYIFRHLEFSKKQVPEHRPRYPSLIVRLDLQTSFSGSLLYDHH